MNTENEPFNELANYKTTNTENGPFMNLQIIKLRILKMIH
jgi:hypothetical protein